MPGPFIKNNDPFLQLDPWCVYIAWSSFYVFQSCIWYLQGNWWMPYVVCFKCIYSVKCHFLCKHDGSYFTWLVLSNTSLDNGTKARRDIVLHKWLPMLSWTDYMWKEGSGKPPFHNGWTLSHKNYLHYIKAEWLDVWLLSTISTPTYSCDDGREYMSNATLRTLQVINFL